MKGLLILLGLIALILVSGCTSEQPVRPLSNETALAEVGQIKSQLQTAMVSGGMSSESYEEISYKIRSLESRGYDVDELRGMLSQIPVGVESMTANQSVIPQPSNPVQTIEEPTTGPDETTATAGLFGQACDEGPSTLSVSPLALGQLEFITPQGRMSGSHVTPTDHQYWQPTGFEHGSPENDIVKFDIMSPADGYIIQIGQFSPGDYRLVLEHSCSLYTIFIHLNKLSGKISSEINFEGNSYGSGSVRIPVSAGEVIGRKNSYSFDFSAHDTSVVLTGFIFLDHYSEAWKIHTVDPFDYFPEPLRSQLREKSLRSAEPVGGKIDYDIAETIQGNWFLEGTGGYQETNVERYWSSHMTFAYDHIDPSQVRISIGDYEGGEADFGVNDGPLPLEVTPESGIVKYELMNYDHFVGGTIWDRKSYAKLTSENVGDVQGVLLVQHLGNYRIKVEALPGKTASQASGFTTAARIYER